MQVLDAAELVAQLGAAHLDHQGGRVGVWVAPGLEVRLPGGVLRIHGSAAVPDPASVLVNVVAPFVADEGEYGS